MLHHTLTQKTAAGFAPRPGRGGRDHGKGAVSAVEELRDLIRDHDRTEHQGVPVHPQLAQVFPQGLRPGKVYSLTGSVTIALALLAEPTRSGSWCAAMGFPDLGLEAAADWGVELERLVLLPRVPATEWLSCLADLIEVCDVVLTAAPPRLSPGELTKLTGRLRHRGGVVICAGRWQQQSIGIRATTIGWDGIGEGHGHLVRQRLRLTVQDRHRERTVDLTIEAAP